MCRRAAERACIHRLRTPHATGLSRDALRPGSYKYPLGCHPGRLFADAFSSPSPSSQPLLAVSLMEIYPSSLPSAQEKTAHRNTPVIVYARWIGYVSDTRDARPILPHSQHIYSAAILPERPLQIGMRIRILATSPAWYSNPQEDQETYEVYDAHIVGAVTSVVG